jgi:hypothetical protein
MPDVEWHPVSETPRREGTYLICRSVMGVRSLRDAFGVITRRGVDWYSCLAADGDAPLDGVTHWASITYPAPPEVE